MFKILHYNGLDITGVKEKFNKVTAFLAQGDFKSAQVKKITPGKYLRAKLDDSNRLLFAPLKYKEQTCLVILEVIRNHDYDKSRFLRGATINEEDILPSIDSMQFDTIGQIHEIAQNSAVHFLDKFIVFDELQSVVLNEPLPLILIGAAGSGKTSLMLEKLKQLTGNILYISLSGYLVQNTQRLYFANNYTNDRQEIDFLSFAEFLDSINICNGKEITINQFMSWFNKQVKPKNLADGRKVFEEFRGVITGANVNSAYLSQEEYLSLGVKQSIFVESERIAVYELFRKYLTFLQENNYYDSSIVAYNYQQLVKAQYDIVLIDEVQDFTNSQLALVLSSLINKEHFFLCGDANQIVHPNFFSWSKLKSYFYTTNLNRDIVRILTKNYRNTPEVVELANRVLKLKNYRFGSMDKESHALVESSSLTHGQVNCVATDSNLARELNQKTALSVNYAVIVLHEEDKLLAQKAFDTPLIFTVQEAKGLEYENVILFNFISNDPQYQTIVANLDESFLDADFTYARTKDKTNKDLEVYKFYVNALYVAITRAVKNIYLVETNVEHKLLKLLDINEIKNINLEAEKSSIEAWQQEANKLAKQGKLEQTQNIETKILQYAKVPWEIVTPKIYHELVAKMGPQLDKKTAIRLLNYALCYGNQELIFRLKTLSLKAAQNTDKSITIMREEYLGDYLYKNCRSLQEKVKRYGVEFRNQFNLTPLMCAALVLSELHVDELLKLGADTELVDNHLRTPLIIALNAVLRNPKESHKFTSLYPKLCPDALNIQTKGRLVKIDPHKGEFFLLVLLLTIVFSYDRDDGKYIVFTADVILDRLKLIDESIVPEQRRKRTYINAILSRNEVNRDYAYNRYLFTRLKIGQYMLNPELLIKLKNDWLPIYEKKTPVIPQGK